MGSARNKAKTEKEKAKAETKGVILDSKIFDPAIKTMVVGGVVAAAGLAAVGVAKLSGMDAATVSMAFVKFSSLSGALISSGSLAMLGRKALSRFYVNKGGRELHEAESHLNTIKRLKRSIDVERANEQMNQQNPPKKSLQSSIKSVGDKQKEVRDKIVANKAKAYWY